MSEIVLQRHARSFYLASRFLPADVRADAAALYAFCRHVDDLADEAPDPSAARVDLDALDAEVAGERPPRALVETLFDVADRRGMALTFARELIGGCRSDLEPVEIPDDDALVAYGYAVAGTVGGLMCGVLGVTHARALRHAVDLGIAMQLTNICRDVAEDARRGRVYLPRNRLLAAGTSPEAVRAGTAGEAEVMTVVRQVLDVADARYASAREGFRYIPLRQRFAIAVAARVYRQIGRRLVRRGGVLAGRTVVPWPEKAAVVMRALGDLVPRAEAAPLLPRHDAP